MRAMSATERAYTDTREKILDGHHAGGEVITEGQVSTALGISRTPVREAFLRLQSEGLLELYPKRGAVVVPLSDDEVTSVMEARELIEAFAATKVLTEFAEPPRALVERMWELVGEQQRHLHSGSITEFHEADTQFHLVMVEACQNAFLVDLLRSLRDRQRRLSSRVSRAATQDRMEIAYREHVALVETIAGGDLDDSLAALRAHLRKSRQALLQQR
ncbi:GntR family transcriptional regulator [Mobilicoccus sp.]|uniref:GntR family transcriptional regulator n=1 Tax=Mobilicoccus sp. TaxID=2034349 RepID=UPI00289E0677|nr:GntR family transcriptional regulator [Mobilicoccus sp.]